VVGTRKSGEHAYPSWTDECVPGFGSLTITDELDGAVVHTRKNRDLDIKVNICEACNTGWMHRLEEQVRGFLCPLMEGKPAVLSAAQQRLTARWTAKTLFALDLTRRGSRVIPEADYNWVMNRNVPPKNISRMWMIAYDGQEGGWKFVRKTLRFGPIGDDSDRIVVTARPFASAISAFKYSEASVRPSTLNPARLRKWRTMSCGRPPAAPSPGPSIASPSTTLGSLTSPIGSIRTFPRPRTRSPACMFTSNI
jgi:hypothetical protein